MMSKKYFRILLTLVLASYSLCACSGGKDELVEESATAEEGIADTEEDTEGTYLVYYFNESGTASASVEYEAVSEDTYGLIDELLTALSETPEEEGFYPVLGTDASVSGYALDGGQLTLDFESSYSNMSRQTEIICRSSVVRTLCQIPDVESISFTVGGESLLDSKSTPIGSMTAESFVENTGDDINVYTTTTLDLYFANEAGDMLVEELVELRYSSNMSVEKLVLEQLIRGPISDDAYPTIPESTNILSVSTRDGVCYVNLDEGFLEYGYDLKEELPIYSIVNSLTEITGVNMVQILINGETDLIFQESISFDTIFERNLDLVEQSDD